MVIVLCVSVSVYARRMRAHTHTPTHARKYMHAQNMVTCIIIVLVEVPNSTQGRRNSRYLGTKRVPKV